MMCEKVDELGLKLWVRIVDEIMVGVDFVIMLIVLLLVIVGCLYLFELFIYGGYYYFLGVIGLFGLRGILFKWCSLRGDMI